MRRKLYLILFSILLSVGLAPAQEDHREHIEDSLLTVQEVTETCLACHEDAASDVMKTIHWTWKDKAKVVPGHRGKHAIGKANSFNNYCVAVESNWERCTSCHVGYGWKDDSFDFQNEENVDCLICHDQTGTYKKNPKGAGYPFESVDLTKVAQSVGYSSINTCGSCHFNGGGGENVKHGDLDYGLVDADPSYDVHMGNDMTCTDCHTTEAHNIMGKSMAILTDEDNRVQCLDCHEEDVHRSKIINKHVEKVACQSCHIPLYAKGKPTKMYWDWSTAGKDSTGEKDEYGMDTYFKKKGSFVWENNVVPEYYWYNGKTTRYLKGDKVDPGEVVMINQPLGDRDDENAKLYPFKVMRGKQIYDTENKHLIIPQLWKGYWTHFDWNRASEVGMKAAKLEYSGHYDFIATEMYSGLAHMVAPASESLKCRACHRGQERRIDWKALGYPGDQIIRKYQDK
ncbi:MAG: tetrathionate reductase family octaheme c-type cytochrome [Candidatus Marinimicrobia bacterium]|nr:tetrathionate reductase family octaheme c-type cytochrome [Candidatus Neomarinimicrobiota bacterium]